MGRHTFTLLAVLFLGGSAAFAQAPPNVDAAADQVFNRVMSPYCPGRVLATCPSGAAETLRQEVRRDLEAGKSPEAIEAGLYQRFGESIRGLPRTDGLGLLAWVIPAAVFTLTGIWLVVWLRRPHRGDGASDDLKAPAASPAILERLEDELADLS